MKQWRWRRVLAAAVVVASVAGLSAAVAAARPDASGAKSTVKVGVVYSRTGLLAAYGAEYIEGLKLGLQYVTNGTGAVNGHPIELQIADDAGDPAKAVSAAKDMIGQGIKIIAGTVSSGVALQLGPLAAQNNVLYISGPAASDAVTGAQPEHVPLRPADDTGRARGRVVPRQVDREARASSSPRTASSARATTPPSPPSSAGGGTRWTRSSSRCRRPTSPRSRGRRRTRSPTCCSSRGRARRRRAMWRALDQQGVFDATTVTTGLAERATWSGFGDARRRRSSSSRTTSTPRRRTRSTTGW